MNFFIEEMKQQQRIFPENYLCEWNKKAYVYDIETYPNYTLFLFRSYDETRDDISFVLSTKPEDSRESLISMFKFLGSEKPLLVGYNNYRFDDSIVKYCYACVMKQTPVTSESVYELVDSILINNELSPEQKKYFDKLLYRVDFPVGVKTLDLSAMFFSDVQNRKRLKEHGVSLGHKYVLDLPYEPGTVLKQQEIENVFIYCQNDLNITADVFNSFKTAIKQFEIINDRCDRKIDVQGLTEVKAGLKWLLHEYYLETGITEKQINKMVRVPRVIRCSEIIPDIQYKTPSLIRFYRNLQQSNITINEESLEKYESLRHCPYSKKQISKEVEVRGKYYKPGVGGLHSKDKPDIFVAKDGKRIFLLDVSGYYPNLIRTLKICPSHLSDVFFKKYCESVYERDRIKELIEQGDDDIKYYSDVSTVLKLRNNGIFGQLLYKYSPVFCPRSGYQVTLSGQLFVLKLIEDMETAGIPVISANTDGIFVEVDDKDVSKMEEVSKNWEEQTQLVLEPEEIKAMYRHSVNDYIAIKTDGKVKEIGDFRSYVSLKKKNDCLIIPLAVKNYYTKGIPVEETIKNCVDVKKFVFSYKASKDFKLFQSTESKQQRDYLQAVVRWYVSKTDDNYLFLYRERINPSKTKPVGDTTKIANSFRSVVCNSLPDEFPIDIDLNFYIQKAKDMISRCEISNIVKYHHEIRDEFIKNGLFPVPQHYKDKARGVNQKPLNYVWSWFRHTKQKTTKHNGFYNSGAIKTGDGTKTIVIDIDKPEKCPELVFQIFKHHWESSNSALFSWSKGRFDDLKDAKLRFKAVYFIKDSDIEKYRNTTKTVADKVGFEIFYGNIATIWGAKSEDGEEYSFVGKPSVIPDSLNSIVLETLSKIKGRKKKQKVVKESAENLRQIGDRTGTKAQQKDFLDDTERARRIIQILLPDWDCVEEDGIDGFKFRGHCPYVDEHSGRNEPTDFDIALKDNEDLPLVNCFHQSCHESVKSLRREFLAMWREERVSEIQQYLIDCVEVPQIEELETIEAESIKESFESEKERLVIKAPTGSGKSYYSAVEIIKRCKNGEKTVYVASNKLEVYQMQDTLIELLGSKENYHNLFIQILESETEADFDDLESSSTEKIKKNTICILTNHSYLLRKGDFSNCYFSLLNWIENNRVHLIIDECDVYLEKNYYSFAIGARYTRKKRKGLSDIYQKVATCPKFSGSGNCSNCVYKIHQSIDVNKFQMPFLKTKKRIPVDEFSNGSSIELPKWKLIDKSLEVPTRGKTGDYISEYRNLSKHKNYWKVKEYKVQLNDGEKIDTKNVLNDYVETSTNPTVLKEFASYKGEIITQEQILELPEHERIHVVYPYLPCDTPQLNFKDESVIRFLHSRCDRIVFLSATVNDEHLSFLEGTIPGLKVFNIEESERKIENLLLIGIPGSLQLVRGKSIFTDEMTKHGKILIFQTSQKRANYVFNKFPRNYPVSLYKEGSILRYDKYNHETTHTIISSSRSALGRGINLSDVVVTVCNSLAIRPTCSFNVLEKSVEEIEELQSSERMSTIEQNFGRSLRGKGNKVHIIYNVSQEDLQFLAERNESMVEGEITVHYVEKQSVMKEKVLKFLDSGTVEEVLPEDKPKVEEFSLKNKLRELAKQGLNWTKASRKLNVDRQLKTLPKEEKKKRKEELKIFYKELISTKE